MEQAWVIFKVNPAGKWNDVDCTDQADNQYALCQTEGGSSLVSNHLGMHLMKISIFFSFKGSTMLVMI